jgi:hypothetical protein
VTTSPSSPLTWLKASQELTAFNFGDLDDLKIDSDDNEEIEV